MVGTLNWYAKLLIVEQERLPGMKILRQYRTALAGFIIAQSCDVTHEPMCTFCLARRCVSACARMLNSLVAVTPAEGVAFLVIPGCPKLTRRTPD